MPLLGSKTKERIHKLNFLCILLLAFAMPLAIRSLYLSYIIIPWVIFWLLEGDFKLRFNKCRFESSKLHLLLPIFYLLHIIALIYTNDLSDGLKHLEVKMSMLIIPILIIGESNLNGERINRILKAFVAGNIVAVITCIIVATIHSTKVTDAGLVFNSSMWEGTMNYPFLVQVKNNWSYFSYTSFSILLHPTYFSMYLLFSIGILVYFLHRQITKIMFIISLLLILLFVIGIFLLGSRAGILCFAFSGVFFMIFKLINSSRKIIFIPLIGITFIGIFFMFTSTRFSLIDKELSSMKSIEMGNTSDHRLNIWNKSIHVIKEHFLLGVGPGDSLRSINYVGSDGKRNFFLNAHNQYLETFIGLGIFGIGLLVTILLLPIILALRKKNFLLLFFIFILSFNFIFESVLERASGIIFFVLFYSLFIKKETDLYIKDIL